MGKTLITLKVDSEEPLAIRTTFQERPPTIAIDFPQQRVISALPERSTVANGVVRRIEAHYNSSFGGGVKANRFLRSIKIVMQAPYTYRVRSERGRLMVEIDHPTSVRGAAMEVGVRGGTIIGGPMKWSLSDRFHAMQKALESATQISLQAPQSPRVFSAITPAPTGDLFLVSPEEPLGADVSSGRAGGALTLSHQPVRALILPQPKPLAFPLGVWLSVLILLMLGAAGVYYSLGGVTLSTLFPRVPGKGGVRLPSGVVLIDQLVWQAFERQGYQLLQTKELAEPPFGTLRVIVKGDEKTALLFVGHGPFFEKQTVERFIRAVRSVNVEQGILVAAGAFTVPAQRIAKEYHVMLVGREQLIELLSAGAWGERVTKQLEESRSRLEEANATLHQYASELEILRRQRNEASWYLGEERAKHTKLETQLAEIQQRLERYEAEIRRWEQEASTLRKQWEEGQWYLGEAQAHVHHLEAQLGDVLQERARRVDTAEHERDETQHDLGEELAKRQALEAQLAELQRQLEGLTVRERNLLNALTEVKADHALQAHGERRAQTRARVSDVLVDLHNGKEGMVFSGSSRDVSSTGVGLETDQELPVIPSMRIRLHVPGHEPIESKAQLMWQRAEGQPHRYQSGFQLLDVSESARILIEQLVGEHRATSA
jgi:hypothetical protein